MTEVDAAGVAQLRDASDALVEAYRGVDVKPGKGAAHARAVAEVLRGTGYPPAVSKPPDCCTTSSRTPRGPSATCARASAIRSLRSWPPSPRTPRSASTAGASGALREQIARAVSPAIDVALADKIATLRYVLHRGARLPRRKRAHYAATAAMAAEAAGHTALVTEVVALLALVDARDRRPAERA